LDSPKDAGLAVVTVDHPEQQSLTPTKSHEAAVVSAKQAEECRPWQPDLPRAVTETLIFHNRRWRSFDPMEVVLKTWDHEVTRQIDGIGEWQLSGPQ